MPGSKRGDRSVNNNVQREGDRRSDGCANELGRNGTDRNNAGGHRSIAVTGTGYGKLRNSGSPRKYGRRVAGARKSAGSGRSRSFRA